ncbi:MAG: hypothetical protein ABSA21_13940 [Candidatus Limnocylindrales bacterium]
MAEGLALSNLTVATAAIVISLARLEAALDGDLLALVSERARTPRS